MKGVAVAGVGMTPFGKHIGRGLRNLSLVAIEAAIADSGLPSERIERIYFGNAIAATVTGQEMIPGQVALRGHALARIPLFNIENACASGGSAFSLACEAVASGAVEVALAVGAEQMSHVDRSRPFTALRGSTDVQELEAAAQDQSKTSSLLMEYYAGVAQRYLDDTGAEPTDFARVAVKNRRHAVLNPLAYLRQPQSIEEVLGSRMIVTPLTLPMCSPVTDGAAAIIVCSEKVAHGLSNRVVHVRASAVASGAASHPVHDAATRAYALAGMGVEAVDVIELHDAAAPAELMQYYDIGLCAAGDGFKLVRQGITELGGRTPVNTSGGLLSRGHPLGATGCAQIVELTQQLRGLGGTRQVENARRALAVNCGGWLDGRYAVAIATIIESQ